MLWAEVTVFSSPAVSLSEGGTRSNLQAHSLLSLKKRDDLKQVAGMWIAGRGKHAHQALRRAVRSLRQFGKSNRGIDEVPQNGLPSLHISGEKALDSFAEKFPAESRVPLYASLNRLFEIPGQSHENLLLLSYFVVLPERDCVLNVSLLTLLRAVTKQDDQTFAIFAEIDPIARSEIDGALINAASNAFDVREDSMESTTGLAPTAARI